VVCDPSRHSAVLPALSIVAQAQTLSK
jgi:hypothetical protein